MSDSNPGSSVKGQGRSELVPTISSIVSTVHFSIVHHRPFFYTMAADGV